MKRLLTLGLAGLLILPAAAASSPQDTNTTLQVTGRGEVWASPDRAVLRLGVTAQAEAAAQAQSNVNASISKALAEIKELGLPGRAIRTVGLQLSPVHAAQKPGREADAPRIVAYRASNTIQVTVDDLSKVGAVIDAAIQAGANRLENLSFQLKDPMPYRTQALQRAVENARIEAQALAKAADVTIRGIRRISEGGGFGPRHEGDVARTAMTMAATPVEPGQLRVEAAVSVLYDITN